MGYRTFAVKRFFLLVEYVIKELPAAFVEKRDQVSISMGKLAELRHRHHQPTTANSVSEPEQSHTDLKALVLLRRSMTSSMKAGQATSNSYGRFLAKTILTRNKVLNK
jgi:hypothetical protein